MLVLKGLGGLHRTVQVQLLQHYWSGHHYFDIEWFDLETNRGLCLTLCLKKTVYVLQKFYTSV